MRFGVRQLKLLKRGKIAAIEERPGGDGAVLESADAVDFEGGTVHGLPDCEGPQEAEAGAGEQHGGEDAPGGRSDILDEDHEERRAGDDSAGEQAPGGAVP